jgi:hypothetical protein
MNNLITQLFILRVLYIVNKHMRRLKEEEDFAV